MNLSLAKNLGRRELLKIGVLAGTGLSLDGYLRRAGAGEVRSGATAKSGILIYLNPSRR